MRLAQAIGLPTAGPEMGRAEGIDYLLVERYDRARTGPHSLERLHQEDFCQALGIVSENKYQNEGGPSLEQCFRLVRETSSVPVLDLLSLLDGVIFNYLIGNNDAHGKNFSLLYGGETGEEARLAPFYDMLSTVYYPELSEKMAMKIGGEYVSEKVYARHFERLAEEAGLGKPMVKRRLPGLAAAIISKLPEVTMEHAVESEVARLIHSRCERVIQRFRE
jgi:serine/threonine-protein kinase HipA